MASIAEWIQKIKTAIYGEEVRGAIWQSLQAMNDELTSAVEDIRVGADGTQYETAGEAVRTQIADLKADLRSVLPVERIYSADFESGYFHSSTGEKQNSSSYQRVPYLVRIDGGSFYCSETASEIQGALFDKNGTFIERVYFEYNYNSDPWLDYIPENAAYVGLYLKTSAPVTDHIALRKMHGNKISHIEYPYADDNAIYTVGKYIDTEGTVKSDDGFALLTLPNVNVGDKYYISVQSTNGVCLDKNKSLLTTVSEDVAPFGRIYTVPAGATQIKFNIRLADRKGVNNEQSNYVAKVTRGKILCIGDSLTWLDGRENYGGMRRVTGWQMMLRKAGFDVRSAGYSGEPYATGLNIVEDVDRCIYNRIVTSEYDVSGYDYIILFGGTNDVLYSGALGDRPTTYADRAYDSSKFNGAISGIISYIRTNNATATILLASFPKSEAVSRSYANASSRVREIEYESDFWSCKYVNIFANMNAQPTYDGFDSFFYDITHPNYNGMVRIGTLMLKAVEEYEA